MIDLLISNANIIDGTGTQPFLGDVLVHKGEILALGNFDKKEAMEVIDAKGRCLTPGFIDIHRHADLKALQADFGPIELSQGITSCISGNCGMSAAPYDPLSKGALYKYIEPCLGKNPLTQGFIKFSDYAAKMQSTELPLNMGTFVGNGAIRIAVKGFDQSPMTQKQLEHAKELVSEAMHSGAMGLSMGIMYVPECSYTASEMIYLAGEAGRQGGILSTHIRGEGDSLVDAVAEVINISAKAEIPLNISHFKAAGRDNWGEKLHKAIQLIEDARARGQDVTCDVYPYEAGSTMLITLIPPSYLSDGIDKSLELLAHKSVRDKLRLDILKNHKGWDNLMTSLGWESVVISSVSQEDNIKYIGRSIADISNETGRDEIDCVCDLLISEKGNVGMVIFSMSLEDVKEVMKLPYASIISDSIYPASGNPHPRLYGAFPRVIAKYVRELGVLTIQEAVKKMTSMPAQRVGLHKRGLVKAGYIADLLLFDQNKVCDTATYTNSKQLALGMDLILVKGQAIVKDGIITGKKSGIFLERKVQI